MTARLVREIVAWLAVLVALFAFPIAVFAAVLIRSRKGLRLLLTGRAEMCGGPFDGVIRTIPRLSAIGLWVPRSPCVIRYPDGSHVEIASIRDLPPFDAQWESDAVWCGTYDFDCPDDRFHWRPTGLESRSEVMRSFTRRSNG